MIVKKVDDIDNLLHDIAQNLGKSQELIYKPRQEALRAHSLVVDSNHHNGILHITWKVQTPQGHKVKLEKDSVSAFEKKLKENFKMFRLEKTSESCDEINTRHFHQIKFTLRKVTCQG